MLITISECDTTGFPCIIILYHTSLYIDPFLYFLIAMKQGTTADAGTLAIKWQIPLICPCTVIHIAIYVCMQFAKHCKYQHMVRLLTRRML